MRGFVIGLAVALVLAIATGFVYSAFQITAEEYFSTSSARVTPDA